MTALDAISLDDVKAWMRIDYNDEDALITNLINQAVEWVENYTMQRIYNRDISMVTYGNMVEVYDFPITSDITATDSDGNPVDLHFESSRNSDIPKVWLSGNGKRTVLFSAGYEEAENIPETLKTAVYKIVHYNFDNRLPVPAIPEDVKEMLATYRRFTWF